ncbi:hypothetical protein PFISCL1PPCAC_5323, partial [Pristionchus fissidentatus]
PVMGAVDAIDTVVFKRSQNEETLPNAENGGRPTTAEDTIVRKRPVGFRCDGRCGRITNGYLRISAVLRLIISAIVLGSILTYYSVDRKLITGAQSASDRDYASFILSKQVDAVFSVQYLLGAFAWNGVNTFLLWAIAFRGKAVCFPVYVLLELIFLGFVFINCLNPFFAKKFYFNTFHLIEIVWSLLYTILLLVISAEGYYSHLKRREAAKQEAILAKALKRNKDDSESGV